MGRREKVVVTFDEKSRRDFVTGFRKRRAARIKKAEKVRTAQERSMKLTARGERRAEEKAKLVVSHELMEDPLMRASEPVGAVPPATAVTQDDFSRRAFGADAVVVTTTLGLLGDDGEDEDDEAQLSGVVQHAAADALTQAGYRVPWRVNGKC